MPGAYREYRVGIHDPRMTTTSVQIGGMSLPLTRSGAVLESPTFVLIEHGSESHPSLPSIEVSGSDVAWAFNADGRRRLIRTLELTDWDAELATSIGDVIKDMDGTWNPENPLDDGAFGKEVDRRVGQAFANRDGWAVDVYVDNDTEHGLQTSPIRLRSTSSSSSPDTSPPSTRFSITRKLTTFMMSRQRHLEFQIRHRPSD
jgi:hypothetical protein